MYIYDMELTVVEEKLDCVLDYYRRNRMDNVPEFQIVGEKVGIELNEIVMMFVEEGFIAKRDGRQSLQITIKGMLFEGFVNKANRLKQDAQSSLDYQKEQMRIQKNMERLQNRMKSLTFWIVIGTLVSAGYYILMIVDYCKSHHLFCCP